ncbi:MAG: adenylate/guanylate cyclase domain-containing protein [Candidatus Nitrosocosmicus sp.]
MPDKEPVLNKKQESEKRKKMVDDQNVKPIKNMVIDKGNGSITNKPIAVTIDPKTIVDQTQERFSRALKKRYQYESNLQPAQNFLLNHVNSKISLVVMYADLVGSTNMSMTLPIDKMVTIIRGFAYEMSHVIHLYEGYVLKYVGDAVIAFFPSNHDKPLACDRAIQCAKSMITVIEKGISPELNQQNYPDLRVKIGLDEGENVIIQHGHDKSSQIDILGYTMNKTAKITSLTSPNTVTIAEDVYDALFPQMRNKFKEVTFGSERWKYVNIKTGQPYKLYSDI